MTSKTKIVSGKNLEGSERKYEFNLMSTKDGLKIFHEYGSLAISVVTHFKSTFASLIASSKDLEEKTEEVEEQEVEDMELKANSLMELLALIPKILTWDRIEELSRLMLSGAKLTKEDETVTLDKDGFCEYFMDDPIELYTAIFWAAYANYPKYISPFLGTGKED